MSERTTTLPAEVADELVELENLVRLLAFATEARRVLRQIDAAKAGLPEVDKGLRQLVDYPNQWQFMPDTTAEVLTQVADRLAAITVEGVGHE